MSVIETSGGYNTLWDMTTEAYRIHDALDALRQKVTGLKGGTELSAGIENALWFLDNAITQTNDILAAPYQDDPA